MSASDKLYTYRLRNLGLPALSTLEDFAEATRLSPELLKYLAFRTYFLYRVFTIPKQSGQVRTIANPARALKGVQGWILRNILDQLTSSAYSKGFERGMSIRDNAVPHIGSNFVLTIDIEDFFPSITGEKVFGIFSSIGYNRSISHILSNLCLFDGRLPQGAPTSPKLANLVCSRLDARISGYAGPKGMVFTRYADDITISASSIRKLSRAVEFIPEILKSEGFSVNTGKTSLAGTRRAKRITGLVVSGGQVGIGRKKYRELRAKLHGEFAGKTKNIAHLLGWISYVHSVDMKAAKRLEAYISRLTTKYPESDAANEFSRTREGA